MYRKYFLGGILLIMMTLGQVKGTAQNLSVGDVTTYFDHINAKYDSADFQSFDVEMLYKSDTTEKGLFLKDEVHASYTISGKSASYKIGNIEFLRNDSFAIAIYHADKIIMLGPSPKSSGGSVLYYRTFIDSFLAQLGNGYTYQLESSAQLSGYKNLVITAIDQQHAIYEKLEFEFRESDYQLSQIIYHMKEIGGDFGVQSQGYTNARKAQLILKFSNYNHSVVDPAIFCECRFIQLEGPGKFTPASDFRDYKIYNNRN